MAKYTVNHICGHVHVHQLFGKGTERERKLVWLATVDCPECYRAAQEAEKAAKNAVAAEENRNAGLPELTGTPKQIAWAESIRATKLVNINALLAELEGKRATEKDDKKIALIDKIYPHMEGFKNATNAAWWIDNRDCYFDARWANEEVRKIIKNEIGARNEN